MKKSFCIIISNLLFNTISLFSQQAPELRDNIVSEFESSDLFFNRKVINPAVNTDTTFLKSSILLYGKWQGIADARECKTFSIESHISKLNDSWGIDFGRLSENKIKSYHFRTNFCQGISINQTSNLYLGINAGVSEFRNTEYDNSFFISKEDWIIAPLFDLGLTYQFTQNTLGFSFCNMVNTKYRRITEEYYFIKKNLNFSYQYNLKVNENFILKPEVLISYDFDKATTYLNAMFLYKRNLSFGINYNTIEVLDIMVSSKVFKYVTLGYIFEHDNSKEYNNSVGTHTFKVGFLLNK
jgi:type IX secretion system PorP/SprF family membrane protein